LALFACSTIAAVQGATAQAKGSTTSPRLARFSVPGTHGFKVIVLASVEGASSPVRIVAEDRMGAAEYQTLGTVTSSAINASFGQLGRIALRFHPSGRVLHNHVSGDPECPSGAAQLGEFTGSLSFRGEGGYTTVSTHRVAGGVGAPTAPIDHHEELSLGCPNANRHTFIAPPGQLPPSLHENSSGFRELSAVATGPGETTAFGAAGFSLRHSETAATDPESCLFVALTEELREAVQIARFIAAGGPGRECPLAGSPASVTVTPPAPFSGTATLQRNGDGSTSWTGSLGVAMLGREPVALAGPLFKAELSR
jgi:hypothetical protein